MTLPTVCAASTIGLTAPDYPDVTSTHFPLPGKRKLDIEHDLVEFQMSSDLPSRISSRTSTSSSIDQFFSDNSEPSHSISSKNADDIRPVKSRKRADDQFAAVVPLDAGHSKFADNDPVDSRKNLQSSTPVSRWKRFSSLTLSSFSSPSSSPRPDSQSISFSNASSSPLVGFDLTPKPVVPNKLVKRSFSEKNSPNPSSGSFRSRIATRKTRRDNHHATDNHGYGAGSDVFANESSNESSRHTSASHQNWFHSFGVKFGRLGFFPQKSGPIAWPHKMQSSSPNGNALSNFGTPTSSPVMAATFRSFSTPLKSPVPESPTTKTSHKRSWSFSNLLNITPPLKRSQSLKAFGARLSGRKGSKTVSEASPTGTSVVFDSQERPFKRRDVSESANETPRELHRKVVQINSPQDDGDHSRLKDVNQTLSDFRCPPSSEITSPPTGFVHHARQFSGNSMSPSEVASTTHESDCGTRGFSSCGEDDCDRQSDTIYDSVRTAMTASSYGGPDIKLRSIFLAGPNDHPIATTADISSAPADTENGSSQANQVEHSGTSNSNISSGAGQSTVDDQGYSGTFSPLGFRKLSGSSSSSASTRPQSSNPGHLIDDAASQDEDKTSSSGDDDEGMDNSNDTSMDGVHRTVGSPPSTGGDSSEVIDRKPASLFDTPQRQSINQADYEMKNSLFDWSEQPSAEKASVDSTPPRPKTVHGKKDAENRGSRSAGRRGPTASHARSQSVPVVPDPGGKRSSFTSKFGTWGVGSKIVTEEWDEDFEFETDTQVRLTHETEEKRVDSAVAMFVPQKIRQQQSNVLANIGLLKEWGMLIEELKELRARATTLGLVVSEHDDFFVQVDAMIDLADQEVDDDGIDATQSISSSPGFNARDFDASPNLVRPNRTQHRPETITEDDVFANPSAESSSAQDSPRINPETQSTPPISGRPRKDSEAVAQSVIELLQKKNKHPLAMLPTERTSKGEKKVPFDTATLKHIVPHVNGLMHKLKNILREAEGLHNSPKRRTDSPFSHVFADPMEDSPTAQRHGRLAARFSNEDDVQDSDFDFKEQELVSNIKMMTIL